MTPVFSLGLWIQSVPLPSVVICSQHITTDDNGTLWIHKPREKTAVMSCIPLLSYPLKVLDKYKNDPELQAKGKLLPVPSNQKMNAYLKEIADICNIRKHLTTHLARHTFATLAIEYGMPIDIIAKILGHSNTNMPRLLCENLRSKYWSWNAKNRNNVIIITIEPKIFKSFRSYYLFLVDSCIAASHANSDSR